jgi:hypothetical protein
MSQPAAVGQRLVVEARGPLVCALAVSHQAQIEQATGDEAVVG